MFPWSKGDPISYRNLRKIDRLLIITDRNEPESAEVIPFLKKDDILLTLKQYRYFFSLFPTIEIHYYEKLDDIPRILAGVDPEHRILVNLNSNLDRIKGMEQFELRAGKYPIHRFPGYHILIKGGGAVPLMRLINRKSRRRVGPRFQVDLRREVLTRYRSLRRHKSKIIYVAQKAGFEMRVDCHYIIEGSGMERENVDFIRAQSSKSLIMSYYADEFIGPGSFHSFLRKMKR